MAIKHPENHAKALTALRSWRDAADAAKEAKSAEGKAHTVAKNAVGIFLREEGLPSSTGIAGHGGVFRYTVSTTERIKPREWHRLWQEGEITEDQYFEALSVTKEEAKDAIGSDQVETISESKPGKDAKVKYIPGEPPKDIPLVDAKPSRLTALRPNVTPPKNMQPSAKPGLRKLTIKRQP